MSKEYYSNNREKILKKKKEYYNNNKESIAKKKKEYNKNPEVVKKKKEYLKEYREKNSKELTEKRKAKWTETKKDKESHDKNKKYHRDYYRNSSKEKKIENNKNRWIRTKNNPELFKKNKENVNRWRSTPSGIYTSLKNRGRKDFSLEKKEFIEWYDRQEKKCSYCGLTIEEINKLPSPFDRKNGKMKFSIDRKDSNLGYEINNITLSCFTCNTIKNNFLSFDDMKKIGEIILKPKLNKILRK